MVFFSIRMKDSHSNHRHLTTRPLEYEELCPNPPFLGQFWYVRKNTLSFGGI